MAQYLLQYARTACLLWSTDHREATAQASGDFKNFYANIPLKRQIIMRDLTAKPAHLAKHRCLVSTVDELAVSRLIEKGRTTAERCWQAYLKACVCRNQTLLA